MRLMAIAPMIGRVPTNAALGVIRQPRRASAKLTKTFIRKPPKLKRRPPTKPHPQARRFYAATKLSEVDITFVLLSILSVPTPRLGLAMRRA